MWTRALLAGWMALALTLAASASTAHKSHRKSSSAKASAHTATSAKSSAHRSRHSRRSAKKSASWRHRGQQGMDPDRIRQIQAALVREHYLQGQPSGIWDQQSKDAMARYQAANGWQTKSLPDARALIRLGLGPDHAGLINPDTAMTSSPGGGAEKAQPTIAQPQ